MTAGEAPGTAGCRTAGATAGAAAGRDGATGGTSGRAGAGALLRGLWAACHPGPTVVVTTLAATLSAGVGSPAGTVVVVTLAVLTGQLSIGWSNDWVDAARDLRVGRQDKPVVRGQVTAAGLRAAALAAVVACAVLSFLPGPLPGGLHLVAVAGGWAYNLRLKSTALSWLPYAVSFGALPAFVVTARPDGPAPAPWVVLVGAALGVGAHLANVLPDLEDDAVTGVRGLPHRLGRRWTGVLAPTVLAGAVVVAVLGPPGAPPVPAAAAGVLAAGLGLVAGLVGLRRPASRMPFTLAMAVAVVCVAVLVGSGSRAVG